MVDWQSESDLVDTSRHWLQWLQWLQRQRFRWLTDSQRVTWTALAILAMFLSSEKLFYYSGRSRKKAVSDNQFEMPARSILKIADIQFPTTASSTLTVTAANKVKIRSLFSFLLCMCTLKLNEASEIFECLHFLSLPILLLQKPCSTSGVSK